jgi:signal transduction histidine kinase
MTAVYFVYGLAFFALGLAAALEARRVSALAFGHHLRWLAAFGFAHSLVEWADMFLLLYASGPLYDGLLTARSILLPLSTLLLVRFGIGLVGEAGPLPAWLTFAPVVLLVPISLLVSYALIVAVTEPPLYLAADVWSRYLLYMPGSLLASFGFMRQWRGLPRLGLSQARGLLLGAAIAFLFNAIVAGLIAPAVPYGLAPWLNAERVLALTGVPVQVWRTISAIAVTFFALRALGVFEAERAQQLHRLRVKEEQAQRLALQAQTAARHAAESWTEGLVGISRSIARLEAVDKVLESIVNLARQLLQADTAALALWDDSGLQLALRCYATSEGVQTTSGRPVSNPLILTACREGAARRFPDEVGEPGDWTCPVLRKKIQAAAIVPLQLDERPLGGLWVTRADPRSFISTDVTGLERLADQAVIAIEHALMAARLQSLAVTEERTRIAREMHDGLAQVLGYLSLEMQTLEALVRQGDHDAVLAELKQARRHIVDAQGDVRENILSLRTTLAGDLGLIPALRQYTEEFQVQTGIAASVVGDVEAASRLSPLAEAQLVRIVQEALANVRKHAQAEQVLVRLMSRNGCLRVIVSDDGQGFGLQTAGRGHFGLQTMRERAESVGGGLTVASAPGAGTQVDLWLPFVQP